MIQSRKTPLSISRDRAHGKYAPYIGTPKLSWAIYSIKSSSDVTHLFAIFPRLFSRPGILDQIHGPPFPRTPDELFLHSSPPPPAKLRGELLWSICRSLQYSKELNNFNKLRIQYEQGIVSGDRDASESALALIESQLGYSTWLIQARLSFAFRWEGLEGVDKTATDLETQLKNNSFASLLLRFMRRRTEATSLKERMKADLSRVTHKLDEKAFEYYLQIKIFEQSDIALYKMGPALAFEGQSSIVDLYEMTVHVLQSLTAMSNLALEIDSDISKPIGVLFSSTEDSRLTPAMRRFSDKPIVEAFPDRRVWAIEAYSKGEYESTIVNAASAIEEDPLDMAMLVLWAKSHVALRIDPPDQPGMRGNITKNLVDLLQFSADAYAAAHLLVTLFDQYYGQTWAGYLRATVMYELRQESQDFPPVWLSDIYARDPFVTPFSAVTMPPHKSAALAKQRPLREKFPNTEAVYLAASQGLHVDNFPNKTRLAKYLAQFNLRNKNPVEAARLYAEAIESLPTAERVRSAGGFSIACMRSGNSELAVDSLVRAYQRDPHVPSALPFDVVANALGDASQWPNSIALPILLQLYYEIFDRDKLPQLRFSFERFQLANGIEKPTDLVAQLGRWGKPLITLYLDKVWRPEVMRQTLIFNGSREIEESRIQVCRVLARLDEHGASRYLNEIKERVKAQEISKGTTLIEQSKVYVDTDAIKKALRTRLSDSYTRYKTSSKASPTRIKEILNTLTEAAASVKTDASLARVLSAFHLMDSSIENEAEAQFLAIFTEVTNEFLKGEHGLNAYLSTRVRHGALSNTLRKPVEDERLVTPRNEHREAYVPNTYWAQLTDRGSADLPLILRALTDFTAEFDEVVDHLRDSLLQVRVVHEFSDTGENPEGLFLYRSSNLERQLVQEYDKENSELDQLVDLCVNTLWEKTDENLANVRRALETQTRDRLMAAFDRVTATIEALGWQSLHVEVLNSVARAKTNTQTKINVVSSWFKRSEVFDRADYAAEFPVHIAINMIKNTISIAANWDNVTITSDAEGQTLPGRSLDAMVYNFYGLLENAIKHSRADIDDLFVNVHLTLNQTLFSAHFTNNIRAEKFGPDDVQRVIQLRDSLADAGSMRRAQAEGRSGLHKIWHAINAPSYLSPRLEFSLELSKEQFFVDLSFQTERSLSEITSN